MVDPHVVHQFVHGFILDNVNLIAFILVAIPVVYHDWQLVQGFPLFVFS